MLQVATSCLCLPAKAPTHIHCNDVALYCAHTIQLLVSGVLVEGNRCCLTGHDLQTTV